MKRWKIRIGDLGRVVTGKTPSTKEAELFDGDYPFITPSDLDYDTYFVRSTEKTVTEKARGKLPNQFVPANTVTYTCIASVGKIGISDRDSLTNQQINSVVPTDDHDARFIYYLLRAETRRIQGLTSGVATPIINKTDFENIEVSVPDRPTQIAIAGRLSAYDEFIANNERRMLLIENAGRLLFREWFCRLHFPGHEHTRIVAGGPSGWEKTTVGSVLLEFSRKKRIPKEDYQLEGTTPCIDQSRDFIGGYTDDPDAVHSQPLPIIVFGDHTRVLKFVDMPFASGADGTQLLFPNREDLTPEFLYFALGAIDLSNYFYARHFKFLKAEALLLPGSPLVRAFTEAVQPILRLVQNLRQQNVLLRRARDLLLPRLMTGEVAP